MRYPNGLSTENRSRKANYLPLERQKNKSVSTDFVGIE
ncbi:hypothetical protein RB3358 [Rhodopirellula baltica SH 1]|uniref:Uncharacterized protein n=1 Tax=Rhodopirellula baltica (strain DSM 10527 / NCIMB 13988 / SH1) TaxID=243090 RepID=Q7UUD7_RHOBA|nr:hypothetical protein RB3358 [Rhodopirellula baltica SH 1]